MKTTCAWCKKPARKFYRIATDDIELVCRKCILKDSQAACGNCEKVTTLHTVWDDGGPTDEKLCRDCFLSATRADCFEINEYREVLEEASS